MAEETKTIVSSPKDYWISPNALSISLNALGEHDRIQASVASGAVIFCYIKDIAAFDFDAGHNFRKWPLVISPTYFNSTTEKYLYVAIPRSNTIGSEAMIVFPSQLLDIYGRAAVKRIVRDEQGNMLDPDGNITTDESKADYYYIAGDQVGSEDYYYIWLHGIITASGDNSANEREWAFDPKYDTGRLNTDETWGEVVTLEDLMIALRAKVNTDWFSRLFILHGYKMSVVYKTDPETGEPLIDEETGEPIVDIDEETGLPKTVKKDVVIQPNAWPQDGDGITITDIESKYGLWTNFFLSALGKNDAGGGGGGGADLFEPLLSINESGLGLPPQGLTGKVGIVWNYATQQYEWGETGGGGGGEGSVTSIGLTAPTGFTVTGSPITSSGTLGLAFADGYSLPTTAKQTLWDEAYNKRHEHSNLNVLEGITSTKVTNWDTAFGWGNHAAAGYALTSNVYTKEQADAKYMTIAAFERLFNPLDSSDQKVSHPYSSGVASIKALFGLWTEQYLSALGKNDSGGGSVVLNGPLEEINNTVFQTTHPTSAWQTIVWNGSAWVYGNAGASSVDWSNITNKPSTFTPSAHTHAWSDITSGVPDFATKTWVGQQGFALASNVYSKTDADAKFMTIAAFENLFNALNSSDQKVSHPYSSGVASIKAMVGLWTEQYLSALGKSDSGGEIVLNEPLASINNSGLAAHPSSSGQTIVWNGNAWTYGTAGGSGMTYTFATGDANGQFKVTPSSGTAYNVSIKGLAALAYKASLAVSDIPDLSGRYLPLTGGTVTGAVALNGGITPIAAGSVETHGANGKLLVKAASASADNTPNNGIVLEYGTSSTWVGQLYMADNGSDGIYWGGWCNGERSEWKRVLDSSNYTNYTYSKNQIDTELAKKLDVAFFDALFQAYSGSTKVTPNASTSSVDNIKAMFGFWTQQYISVLGKNDSQGSGGIDWDALAANTNEQINVSHLTTALAPYALTSQIPTSLKNPYKLTITLNGTATEYDGSAARSLTINTGLDQQALTTYLSSKILTVKNGTATLGTWNPTAAGVIDIASAVSGYLPLSGGTMTGTLKVATGSGIEDANGNGLLVYHPTNWNGISASQWGAGAIDCQGVIRSNASDLKHYRGNALYNILDSYNSGISGSTITINGTSINSVSHIEVGTNDLKGYAGSFFFGGVSTLHANYDYVGFQAGNSFDKWQVVAIDGLKWRQNDNGGTDTTGWNDWRTILDSHNSGVINGKVTLNSTPLNVPISYNLPTPGTFTSGYWHRLGNYVTAGDGKNLVITIYDGTGYNGSAEQNSIARIVIKDGWQSTRAAANSVGVSIERFANFFDLQVSVVATEHNAGALWVYLPWQYAQGTYTVEGIYTSWEHHNGTDGDTTTAPVTNQTFNNPSQHSYLYFDYAFLTSNVASATKLHTTRYIWGNAFDGTADINGNLIMPNNRGIVIKDTNGVDQNVFVFNNNNDIVIGWGPRSTSDTYITGNTINIARNGGTSAIYVNTSNNVGIGGSTGDSTYKLTVAGAAKVNELWIGNIRITASADGIHIANGGLSANTYVSALGVGQEGGGGEATLEDVWNSMAENDSSHYIHISHIQSALSSYLSSNNYITSSSITDMATRTWVGQQGYITSSALTGYATQQWVKNQGYVTNAGVMSVGMSVPTGLRVNSAASATITGTGTFALTFTSGYSIPTTANQSNWDTAYGWGNHATAGYSTPQGVANQMQSYAYISGNVIHIGDNSITPLTSHQSVDGTFWGRSWSNHGTVSGSIEAGNSGGYIGGFDHIDLNTHASLYGYGGYIDFYYNGANSYTSRLIEEDSGLLALRSPYTLGLLVGGYNGDYVQIGQIRIVYESSNNALRIENANNGGAANLYAMGGISALGMSGNADGTISGNLIPSTNAKYSIGSSSYGWKELRLSQYGVSGRITIDGDGINIVSNEGGYLSGALYMVTGRMIVGASDDDYDGFTFATEGTSYLSSKVSIGGTNSNSDKLYVNGTVRASSYNNSSDARLKNIISNENIDIETIARAPIVRFTWKNTDDSRVHWGTLAQYWRSTEIGDIVEDGEYLAMDYAATALAGVISVARKVMTHEEEIAALKSRLSSVEQENKAIKLENQWLRNEIEQLKAA